MTDDGMNTGILYRGKRKPYGAKPPDEIADLQARLEVGTGPASGKTGPKVLRLPPQQALPRNTQPCLIAAA